MKKNISVFFSLIVCIVAFTQNNITSGEYWIDSDYNNKTNIVLTPNTSIHYQDDIDVSTLKDGLHTIHYRFKDETGKWSSALSYFFMKAAPLVTQASINIVSFEYWFNSDIASRTTMTVSLTEQYHYSEIVDVSLLKNGLNTIHYRFKDETGKWSGACSNFFVMGDDNTVLSNNEITKVQYWFNSDLTTIFELSTSEVQTLSYSEIIDAATLKNGLHTVHYRFADAQNKWSSAYSHFFIKSKEAEVLPENKIVAYRYWVDTDEIKEFPVSDSLQNIFFVDTLGMYKYRKGQHYLHMQFKDQQGVWSSATATAFNKIGFPIANFFADKEIVCDTGNVQLTDISYDTDSIEWYVNNQIVASDSIIHYRFEKTGLYEVTLRAIDTSLSIDSTKTLYVRVDSVPQQLILRPAAFEICEGDSMDIEAINGYTYVWSTNENTQVINGRQEGWYKVEATSIYSCTNQDSVYLIMHQNPVVDLGRDTTITLNNTLLLDAGNGFIQYAWSDLTDQQTTEVLANDIGLGEHTYYVDVVDANQCMASDTIKVSVTVNTSDISNLTDVAIKIYPVPVQTELFIEIPGSVSNAEIAVYNLNGKILHREVIASGINSLDLGHLVPGSYSLLIKYDNQIHNSVIIVH